MRLLVVDDEPGLAEALAAVLMLHRKYSEVMTAQSFESGLRMALERKPDVAILDQHLGDGEKTGIDLAAELHRVAPGIRTLILTADASPEAASQALRAGADGFILKNGILRRLDDAVESVFGGRRFIDPAVAADVVLRSAQREPEKTEARPKVAPAELAVLRAVAQGMSNEEIAQERKRSVETVRAQLHRIYGKLGVSSREKAVEVARRLRLI